MAKVYGEVDSFKSLLAELRGSGIQFLKSLDDIEEFRSSYTSKINAARAQAQEALRNEKERLRTVIKEQQSEIERSLQKQEELLRTELGSGEKQLADLEQVSTSNPFKWLYLRMKRWKLKRRLSIISDSFEEQKRKPFRDLINRTAVLESRLRNLEVDPQKHFYSAFLDKELSDLRKANRILKDLRSNYLGAVGEVRAVRELQKLPDSYRIINDFRVRFRNEGAQVDHLVIGPTGIFLIETKNWSQHSIENVSLRSPVEQIRKANKLVYILLRERTKYVHFFHDHWGQKRIQIRNVILMMNQRPAAEYEFVKIVLLDRINRYIEYFEAQLSATEVDALTEILLSEMQNR